MGPTTAPQGSLALRPGRRIDRAAPTVNLEMLSSCAYRPCEEDHEVVLRNCPFHALAQEYRDLVCGMNLALMTGFADEIPGAHLEARLVPQPGRCCVRLARSDARRCAGVELGP